MNKFNAVAGLIICVCSILLVIVFSLMPVSQYWLVIWTLIGGAGLLLSFWEAIMNL